MEDFLGRIKIPYYIGGIQVSECKGYQSLSSLLADTQNPSAETKALFTQISEASASGDKKRKTELKEQLKFYTPAVQIPIGMRRLYDNINGFNELAQLDFDGLEMEQAIDFKDFLFNEYESVVSTYLSPSKNGVKGLIRIPLVRTVSEFKEYYLAITEEMEIYDGFDPSPKNAVLPLFQSYDPFVLVRENPKVWDRRKEKEDDIREQFPLPMKPYRPTKANERHKARAINTYRKAVNSIVSTPGHYQLRSASLIFGTRVGFGYISFGEAISEADKLIESNRYLSKGVRGYKKTAHWAITEGMKTPKGY